MKKVVLWVLLFPIFLSAQNWEESYDTALVKAKNEEKPLILVFSGSDWCAPCRLLDERIWKSEDFKAYSEGSYVLYKADFPRKKSNQLAENLALSNNKLAKKYNPKGYFPLVVVLDGNETVLGETGYKRKTPKAYIALLNSFIQ